MAASPDETSDLRSRLDLLKQLGFGELRHDSHVPFLSHLVGTRRLLAQWNARPELCDAGLFHSAYGTEFFEPDRVADRADVVAIIGPEAERIAWLWCAIRRDTLDVEKGRVRLRRSNALESLTRQEVADIVNLWAADVVEQIQRMEPGERAFALGVLDVAHAASEPAQLALRPIANLVGARTVLSPQ